MADGIVPAKREPTTAARVLAPVLTAIGCLGALALTALLVALLGFYCHLLVRTFDAGWRWVS